MKLAPIAQPSLVDEVAGRIRQFVESGDLQAGDRLPSEPELVEKLRVSRTVLREAISRLESIGLLRVKRGLGTFVGDRNSLAASTQLIRTALAISPHDLLQVSLLRRAIETQCARTAAARITDEQISELEIIHHEMSELSRAQPRDMLASMRRDFDFHLKLVEIGGNELMRNVIEVLQEFVIAAMVQTLHQPGLPQPAKDQHQEMLDAVRARDPKRAEAAAAAHMDLLDARLKFVLERGAPPGLKAGASGN